MVSRLTPTDLRNMLASPLSKQGTSICTSPSFSAKRIAQPENHREPIMNFKYMPKFCRTSRDTNAIKPTARREAYRALGSSDAPPTGSNVNSHLGTMAPSSSRVPKPLGPGRDLASQDHGDSCRDGLTEVIDLEKRKAVVGVLEVYIHQAKELKDICIYHKQDVYATISFADDPETVAATQTVNGGGKSPLFNEKLRLNVHSLDSTLRCEIWMFSRIRNYLQDQSLGFVLVPLSHVISRNGRLQRRFTLSSSELFHSPCGTLYLTITYTGTVPEVLEIPSSVVSTDRGERRPLREELERIEIPNPRLVEENERMVAEYYAHLDAQAIIAADAPAPAAEPSGAQNAVAEAPTRVQTPPGSMLVDGSPSVTVATNSPPIGHTSGASTFVNQNVILPVDKGKRIAEGSGSASQDVVLPEEILKNVADFANPLGGVQEQDFVEMYMKSLQECKDALDRIILPVNPTAQPANPDEEKPEEKGQSSKDGASSSKVFYGSRAFF